MMLVLTIGYRTKLMCFLGGVRWELFSGLTGFMTQQVKSHIIKKFKQWCTSCLIKKFITLNKEVDLRQESEMTDKHIC